MRNTQNITIVLLLLSAGILTAVLIGMHVSATPRAEAQVTVKQGQYIMSVGTYSKSADLVYILNIKTGKMNAYQASRLRKSIGFADQADLARVFRRLRNVTP